MISDGHDLCCGCTQPFAHLLDSIFPEGHKDRDKTIRYIINRDLQCLSGGPEEEKDGLAAGTSAATLQLVKEEGEEPGHRRRYRRPYRRRRRRRKKVKKKT